MAQVGDVNSVPAVVTLEDFFVGNGDGASIWCNLATQVPTQEIFRSLKAIRDRADVANVLVRVSQYDGGADEWPFSDVLYFITSALPAQVVGWLGEGRAPDETWIAKPDELKGKSIPTGMHAIALWWD